MAELWDDCSAFVGRHICKILAALTLGLVSAVAAGLSWYVAASDALDRQVMSTDLRATSTAQALDALTAETRSNSREIAQTLAQIQSDLRLLTYRIDTRIAVDEFARPTLHPLALVPQRAE